MRDAFIRAAPRFHLAVLLPMPSHAVPEHNDDGLRRQRDITLQILRYTTSLGLLQQLPPDARTYVPSASASVEERVAEIIAVVRGS